MAVGGICLTEEEMADPDRLAAEAMEYAIRFSIEEDGDRFFVGCSNWSSNRAFFWTIEAARCLAGCADKEAIRLLELAVAELKRPAE